MSLKSEKMEANTALHHLSAAPWFNQLVAQRSIVETKTLISKEKSPHYVVGRHSPFYFRFATTPAKSIVVAVWCGQNATNMGGKVQGGAISSIFDALTASVGSFAVHPNSFGLTKSLSVKFKSPTPLQTVLKFSVINATFNDDGIGRIQAELSNGTGKTYATCVAEMVDVRTRKKWKEKMKIQQHPRADSKL